MKTIIVTGSNSGIGKEAALMLAESGHRILMLCRDSDKSREAQAEILAQSGNKDVHLFAVDLADQASVRAVADQIKHEFDAIDVLVNNAGVYKTKRAVTPDGIEMTFAVNYLAPFMLTQLLLDTLRASGDARIVNVISELYKNGTIDFDNLMLEHDYKAGRAYANSKLACALFTIELANRTLNEGITVNALHPGVLATDAFRDYPDFVMKVVNLFLEKPEKGGERIAYLAVSEDVRGQSGNYFYKSEPREFEISVEERSQTQRLWQVSDELCGF